MMKENADIVLLSIKIKTGLVAKYVCVLGITLKECRELRTEHFLITIDHK